MTGACRRVVITGAGGFIGSRLAKALAAKPDFKDCEFVLTDLHVTQPPGDDRVQVIEGDLANPGVQTAVLAVRPDIVFHLAGVLGGAAEADYALSRRVNVDATLDLFERLRDAGNRPRVIFASSIAVFGAPLGASIDDDTMPVATMSYGAQKRMMEVVLEQFSARGWIDGLAIRLPGVVARPGADARLKSAFLNNVFYACAAGDDFTMPVSPGGTTWLISVPSCVAAFVHAARVPADSLGPRRAFNLPAQRVVMADLVKALLAAFPTSPSQISWAPDPELDAQFACQPPLTTTLGDSLGFKHDGDLAALVQRALLTEGAPAEERRKEMSR